MTKPINKLRGDHNLNFFVSYQMKERIMRLAERYERTMSDMIRILIKVGIPVMEGLTEAEERILKETILTARKLKKVRQMKIEEEGYEDDQLITKT